MPRACPHCRADLGTAHAASCPGCGRAVPPAEEVPERVGRYCLTGKVAAGGFAVVYRGHDPELGRVVAVKVMHRKVLASPGSQQAFLDEARILAGLEHPGIVPIYDIGRTDDGLVFLVTKLIEGSDLKARLAQGRLPFPETAAIVARVAEALHHAHEHGLVHRDVKPANVLLDSAGTPLLVDFGLALREQDYGKGPTDVGTPLYMSPEQARKEGHLVDGRSDVYSLGVVLYEMLTGRHPFRGRTFAELTEFIRAGEAVPPRQVDPAVPEELERVWRRATGRHASDRYPTARAFADDLWHWLKDDAKAPAVPAAAEGVPAPRVVPRGLRSFGRKDADFFLDLLPGPRDRDGLPDSVQFWKARLESTDPDEAVRVGLLYGPSGCGKSSLLRAGVLPRLAGHVVPLFVEATPDQTEARLLQGLRRLAPAAADDAGPVEALWAVRRGGGLPAGKKLVLVFDQFEQWLSADRPADDRVLVEALRQCDGVRVQALLLVRDEFWLAVSRFLRELEVRLVEGENAALVDLFDPAHARAVLAQFGRAYGRLPAPPATPSAEQDQFLDRAVAELADGGQVIPVRLSLFTEMVKGKPWVPDTLDHLGGVRGTGVAFLEETFSAPSAPAAHRHHQQAARAVLRLLLPEPGTDLKGRRRSREELQGASGYGPQSPEFADLLRLLDQELRLITPAEDDRRAEDRPAADGPPPSQSSVSGVGAWGGSYQLTHDYLVPALREWLTRKQRETRRGRAELRLAERAAWWASQPERRQLPGPWEWATIALLTDRRQWTEPQRAVMRAATRHHLARGALVLLAAVLLWQGGSELHRRQAADLAAQHAADQVAQLRSAPIRNVEPIVAALGRDWPDVEPRLRAALQDPGLDTQQQRNLRLALLRSDPGQAAPLVERALNSRPDELLVLREALWPYREQFSGELWRLVDEPNEDAGRRLRAAGALAGFDPDSSRWAAAGKETAATLLRQNPLELTAWLEVLRPVRRELLGPLAETFRRADDGGPRRLVAVVLADYAADQPARLTELVLAATPEQFPLIWPAFRKYGADALARLNEELDRPADPAANDEERAEAARRQAQAAVVLVQLGHEDRVWPLLRLHPDRTVRSYLVHLLAVLHTDPQVLARRWRQEDDPGARQALTLSLGESDPAGLPPGPRQALAADWLALYRDDPDPGLHAALDWALRQHWGRAADVGAADAALAGKPSGGRHWFVNGQGQTFVVVPGPVEVAAAGPDLPATRIPRTFAVGARDVTVAQYARFQDAHPEYRYPDFPAAYVAGPDSPMIWLTWFDAAAYCRWLSEQEGVPESEMCYPPRDQIKPGMKLPADYLARTGYRLPTAAEWRCAARAGTATPRFYGHGERLLAQFGWYAANAAARAGPAGSLKPNGLGLFDVYGNVWQWCQDRAFRPAAAEDREDEAPVEDRVPRLMLGGSFADQAFELTSDSFAPRRPTECHVNYGLRLARTVR